MTVLTILRRRFAHRVAKLLFFGMCAFVGWGVSISMKKSISNSQEHTKINEEPMTDSQNDLLPYHVRISNAIRCEKYDLGLRLIQEHQDVSSQDDYEAIYCEALCREGLGEWIIASELYRQLVNDIAPDRVRLAGLFGITRCQLARIDEASALLTLDSCEPLSHALPNGRSELLFLRAVVALRKVTKPQPGPFAPNAVAWMRLESPAGQYLDWLAITANDPSSDHDKSTQLLLPRVDSSIYYSTNDQAERAISQALTAPNHPSAIQLRLAAANLVYLSGRIAEATRMYQRLQAEVSLSNVCSVVNYNLGLCHLKSWALPSAHAALLDAADSDPKNQLSSLGWWWIGRIELERGDTSAARKAWDKATVHGDREIESAVGLGEVLTHLLDDEPDRAFSCLRRSKSVSAYPHPELTEAFSCLMRYANAESVNRKAAVAVAIEQANFGRAFGPAGEYLFARSLQRVGRTEEALAVYETAIESAHGQWGIRMMFSSAELLLLANHRSRAKTRFETVAAADPSEIGDQARLLLAEMAIKIADGETCVNLCRTLLERDTVRRESVLLLMGRGYELLGFKSSAAECFAGRVPSGKPTSVSREIRR